MQIEIIIRIQRIVYQVNKFCNRRATRVYDIFSGYFCHRFFYPIRKFLRPLLYSSVIHDFIFRYASEHTFWQSIHDQIVNLYFPFRLTYPFTVIVNAELTLFKRKFIEKAAFALKSDNL